MPSRVLYYAVKILARGVMWIHNRFEIQNADLIPDSRPVIVAVNHVSNLDPVVTAVAFPGRLRPLAKEELFQMHPIFTWLISTLGAIPVSRKSGFAAASALKNFLALLQGGESLMIFPEGSRSLDGRLQPIEGGVTVLATKERVPIVPLYIAGSFEAMPVGSRRIGWNKIIARFGNPVMPMSEQERADLAEKTSPREALREERERIRTQLQGELQRLEESFYGVRK